MSGAYRRLALSLFGRMADRYMGSFEPLKKGLVESGVGILLRTWVSIILLSVFLSYVISLIGVFAFSWFFPLPFELFFYIAVFIPILIATIVFVGFYIYPIQKASGLQKSIETDLPFALAHMSAIASSGIPPEFMFKLITEFKEYRSISTQARMIVRNINTYGMSSVNAINDVAKKSPSPAFKQVLNGLTSTIEKGGDMVKYFEDMSERALFDYRIRREKYLKTLSTYADIYTALLVAAPLMMLAVLGVMSIIGGLVMGMSIQDIITMVTWLVLPFLNIGFLLFIHITYPGI